MVLNIILDVFLEYAMMRLVHIRAFEFFHIQHKDFDLVLWWKLAQNQ